MISRDFGLTWENTQARDVVFVISPGAGCFFNRRAYDHLGSQYEVKYIDAHTRESGFDYPSEWRDNESIVLNETDRKGLKGLANRVGKKILKNPPSVIICGSRGSQVTIGLIWKHYWRGASVCINAGPLTTKTVIPLGVYPVMITMENDYFDTQYETQEKFFHLSEVDGKNILKRRDSHMPNLSTPPGFLLNTVEFALRKREMTEHGDYDVSTLYGHRVSTAVPQELTIQSRHKYTFLRGSNTSERTNFSARVENGMTVNVIGQSVDEKGVQMLHVVNTQTNERGWIYAMNIRELR